jgi:hypothetical protein
VSVSAKAKNIWHKKPTERFCVEFKLACTMASCDEEEGFSRCATGPTAKAEGRVSTRSSRVV